MTPLGKMTLVVEGAREDYYFPETVALDESAWRGFISMCTRLFRQDHGLPEGVMPEVIVSDESWRPRPAS